MGKLNPGVVASARRKKQKVQRHRGMPVVPEEQPAAARTRTGEKEPGLLSWFQSVYKTLVRAVKKNNFKLQQEGVVRLS